MKGTILKSLGIVGVIAYLPLFLLTFADPQLIEKSAQEFVKWKLKSEVNEKIDSFEIPQKLDFSKLLKGKAQALLNNKEARLTQLKSELKNSVSGMVAAQLAKLGNLSCECRKKWVQRLNESKKLEVATLEATRDKLKSFTQAKYMQIVAKLTMDVRIFLASNLLMFLFLMAGAFAKPKALVHLFVPGILLFSATLLSSYFYVFEQNWFYTIIYNDYVGVAYLGYLVIVFLFLCDIFFNKAQITSEIINGIFQAIGSAFSVVPC